MNAKRKPARKCVGCGEIKDKSSLIRIVRDLDGGFCVDINGKTPGRGAYVCNNSKCISQAKKGHRIEKSFRGKVPGEVYENLDKLIRDSGE